MKFGIVFKPLKDWFITGKALIKSYEYKNKAYVRFKDDVPSFLKSRYSDRWYG